MSFVQASKIYMKLKENTSLHVFGSQTEQKYNKELEGTLQW